MRLVWGESFEDKAPAEMLWGAVLAQAYQDVQGDFMLYVPGNPAQRQSFEIKRGYILEDARRWFEGDRNMIGSFLFVCDVLDLDPGRIREYVRGIVPKVPGRDARARRRGKPDESRQDRQTLSRKEQGEENPHILDRC